MTAITPLRFWDRDRAFVALMDEIAPRTLVDHPRCHILYQLAQHCLALPGEIAELGVYRGGSARLLATVRGEADKTIHLFDTFAGMPPADPVRDRHREGDFNDTSFPEVREYLAPFPKLHFHPGIFPATAAAVAALSFCLVPT